MVKHTKYCLLDLYLTSGARITGKYHVQASTSSTVRPSDALRDQTTEFVLLSDATVHRAGQTYQKEAVLIRADAVDYIELPPGGWVND